MLYPKPHPNKIYLTFVLLNDTHIPFQQVRHISYVHRFRNRHRNTCLIFKILLLCACEIEFIRVEFILMAL